MYVCDSRTGVLCAHDDLMEGLLTPRPFLYFLNSLSQCSEPEFLNFYGAQESIPRNQFRQPGRYDNPIPTRFLSPTDCLKIPALEGGVTHPPSLLLPLIPLYGSQLNTIPSYGFNVRSIIIPISIHNCL